MFEPLLPAYNLFADYVPKLVTDIPDEQLAAQPVAGVTMNHAAWTLGHIAWVNDFVIGLLGQPRELPDSWGVLVKPGTQPAGDRGVYPPKSDLLAALYSAHTRLLAAATGASTETLASLPPERLRARFPNIGALTAGLMVSHYANHTGQLSAWRRAMGFKSVY